MKQQHHQHHHQPNLRLLPHSFKFIGRGIILLAIILIALHHRYESEFKDYNSILARVFLDMIIIGFLLHSFAKEKIEDELLTLIRLQSAAYAFIISVLFVILYPIFFFIIDRRIADLPVLALILISLMIYSLIFELRKRNR